MGLTIHWKLKSLALNAGEAQLQVEKLHRAAMDIGFTELSGITVFTGEKCDYQKCAQDDESRWLLIQSRGTVMLTGDGEVTEDWKKARIHHEVTPTTIITFSTWPGEGCEPANFGLCQFPETIETERGPRPTGMSGWSWHSFCKTQYASNPDCGGVANFLRCHLSVIALLDKAKELGILDHVSDEGDFWENRDVKALADEVGEWNTLIAAMGSQLKDALGEDGKLNLVSEISQFPNVEHLEASGAGKVGNLVPLIQMLKNLPKAHVP